MKINDFPVLGVCGYSNSGKTTLVESLLLQLRDAGLKIAVVKHSSSLLEVDIKGKDSDRFFSAGADVYVGNKDEFFVRGHKNEVHDLHNEIVCLAAQYDLILVEGHKFSDLPKIWLLRKNEQSPPDEASEIITTLDFDVDRVAASLTILNSILDNSYQKSVLGCVLVGGESSRMGKPKHLIEIEGKTWLDIIANVLTKYTSKVIAAGNVTLENAYLSVLPDVLGCKGPLGGILAVRRWAPFANFIICACDMPHISNDAITWLLEQRKTGVKAVVPIVEGCPNPLFAYYDYRAGLYWEELFVAGESRITEICRFDGVITPEPPKDIQNAWKNLNYPWSK